MGPFHRGRLQNAGRAVCIVLTPADATPASYTFGGELSATAGKALHEIAAVLDPDPHEVSEVPGLVSALLLKGIYDL